MQHRKILKEDKRLILKAIGDMDKYGISNIGQLNYTLLDTEKQYYNMQYSLDKTYKSKKVIKDLQIKYSQLKNIMLIMEKYNVDTRDGMNDKVGNIEEQIHKVKHQNITMVGAGIGIIASILAIPFISDIISKSTKTESTKTEIKTSINTEETNESKPDTNVNVVKYYDLTNKEIDEFIQSYNNAYTEAIANKENLDKEPSDYFEGIIVEDSPYKNILNEYIKNNYNIYTHKFTANYKDAVYYKDKGILLINHAVIDSEVIGGEKIRRPEGEVNRAAFEIEVKVIDGNKKILIKDKLKNEEIDSRLSLI